MKAVIVGGIADPFWFVLAEEAGIIDDQSKGGSGTDSM